MHINTRSRQQAEAEQEIVKDGEEFEESADARQRGYTHAEDHQWDDPMLPSRTVSFTTEDGKAHGVHAAKTEGRRDDMSDKTSEAD